MAKQNEVVQYQHHCRVGKDLSEPFVIKRGFTQSNPLCCSFFYLALEKIVRAAKLNRSDITFYKTVQLLAYAEGINIVGLNKRAFNFGSSKLDKVANQMGLVVNKDNIDNYDFEIAKDFVCIVCSREIFCGRFLNFCTLTTASIVGDGQ